MGKKVLLMILDGWGNGDHSNGDVVYSAQPEFIQNLQKEWPTAQLMTCGEHVGLPDGQMGNSEVGHLNIGAGRVIYQDLVKINKAIEDNTICKNNTLVEAFEYAKNNNKQVHFLGLLSDGGVHSVTSHLYKLCDMTAEYGLDRVFVHALMDGRDTDPKSGLGFMQSLVNKISGTNVRLASICGRYYTMDRDKRWERVKEGYDLLVHGTGYGPDCSNRRVLRTRRYRRIHQTRSNG